VDAQERRLQEYLANAVMTASPVRRLLMLFDQLQSDLSGVPEAFERRDWKAVNDRLVHAQEILFALRDPLDRSTPLGASLASIYDFCLARLLECNLRKDLSLLPAVEDLVAKIAEANRVAAERTAHEQVAAGA
jgi:flagellar protein FliS